MSETVQSPAPSKLHAAVTDRLEIAGLNNPGIHDQLCSKRTRLAKLIPANAPDVFWAGRSFGNVTDRSPHLFSWRFTPLRGGQMARLLYHSR